MINKFICRCSQTFSDFLQLKLHTSTDHHCGNVSLNHVIKSWRSNRMEFKFYWQFECGRCNGRKFSSGAITAIANLNKKSGKISIAKTYPLSCLKCKKQASFIDSNSLNQYLTEKVHQKLIFASYPENFGEVEIKERELSGHIQSLCSRCQELGYSCLTETSNSVAYIEQSFSKMGI